jgi:hypothetical protein
MERREVAIVVAGLAIVMVMAFIVKPALTGKPVDIGIPVAKEATPVPTVITPVATTASTPPTSRPTPSPTAWNGASRQISMIPTPTPTQPPKTARVESTVTIDNTLVTYATIRGSQSGMTETFRIPFPYWEIHYTVDPSEQLLMTTETPTMAAVAGYSGAVVIPRFSIRVVDASSPSETVRMIEPRGGLDPALWKMNESQYDPRPWIETFYQKEPDTNYFFVITAHMIKSYTIQVMVPKRYIGQF